ncbi:MAG: AlkA N-terminal domain-containing protein [Parahaliea sp.]
MTNDNTQTDPGLITRNASLPDQEICRRARLSRDPRFDGEFFLGVRSTGIYCRPICPARAAAEKNVIYFRYASQAAEAGFRPCLRCRPEAAPGSPAWAGSETSLQRAIMLINAGALNDGSIETLADRLGLGARYLRKLFQRELGISPIAMAQHQRLLFARQLLAESSLGMTDIAFAAGYGSVRRFNSAIAAAYGKPPSALRRQQHSTGTGTGTGTVLILQYRPPYDWAGVIDFFHRHAIEDIEEVSENHYRRQIYWQGQVGSITVTHLPQRHALQLLLDLPQITRLMPLVARVRRMFDLDANPAVIGMILEQTPALQPLVQRFPGIRSPSNWSVQESCVRAIVGQQVSIVAARTVCARLAKACTDSPDFPDPAAIAALSDEHFAMPSRRRTSLRATCRLLAAKKPDDVLAALADIPGIGPWTLNMVALRGLGSPDVFPHKDLGLIRAWQTLSTQGQTLEQASINWQPFRSYAANLLWRSL